MIFEQVACQLLPLINSHLLLGHGVLVARASIFRDSRLASSCVYDRRTASISNYEKAETATQRFGKIHSVGRTSGTNFNFVLSKNFDF